MLKALRSSVGGYVAKILFALLIGSFALWGVGDMITRARKAGVATPNLRMAYAHLQVYLARRARGGIGKPAM